MPDVPNRGQVLLLLLGVGVFVVGGIVSLARLRDEGNERLRLVAKICLYVGVCISLGVLIWHSFDRRSWMPLEDNFDTLIWLGLFLAFFVAYVQRVHPLRGLDWFVMPIVILLLTAAAFFGRAKPHEYLDTSWSWLHRVTAFGGAVAFAVGGAAGAMYLIASRQLRAASAGLDSPRRPREKDTNGDISMGRCGPSAGRSLRCGSCGRAYLKPLPGTC